MKMFEKIVSWWSAIAMPLCIVNAVVRGQYELVSVWALAFGWFLIARMAEKKVEYYKYYRRKKFETELAKKECEVKE